MNLAPWRAWIALSLRRAAWAPLLLFGMHVVASRGFDAYRRYPPLDIPMHFFGGVAIAYFFAHAALVAPHCGLTRATDRLTHAVLVLALTCSATVGWEWAEFVSDRFLGTHAQVDLADTMKDMLMGSLGVLSLVAFVLPGPAAPPANDPTAPPV